MTEVTELEPPFSDWLQWICDKKGLNKAIIYRAFIRAGGETSQATLYRWFTSKDATPAINDVVFLIRLLEDIGNDEVDVKSEFGLYVEGSWGPPKRQRRRPPKRP